MVTEEAKGNNKNVLSPLLLILLLQELTISIFSLTCSVQSDVYGNHPNFLTEVGLELLNGMYGFSILK